MTTSRHKGTSWESKIIEYLRSNGVPYAERRALSGSKDRGDIAGIPGLVVEAKSEKSLNLSGYLTEVATEVANDGARVGLAWVKRRGKASPADAYVVMTGEMLVRLLRDAGYIG